MRSQSVFLISIVAYWLCWKYVVCILVKFYLPRCLYVLFASVDVIPTHLIVTLRICRHLLAFHIMPVLVGGLSCICCLHMFAFVVCVCLYLLSAYVCICIVHISVLCTIRMLEFSAQSALWFVGTGNYLCIYVIVSFDDCNFMYTFAAHVGNTTLN